VSNEEIGPDMDPILVTQPRSIKMPAQDHIERWSQTYENPEAIGLFVHPFMVN